MEKIATAIPDVFMIVPKVFGDERGFFLESYNRRSMAALGIDAEFVQDNHSRSAKGVLRGFFTRQRIQVRCEFAPFDMLRAAATAACDGQHAANFQLRSRLVGTHRK